MVLDFGDELLRRDVPNLERLVARGDEMAARKVDIMMVRPYGPPPTETKKRRKRSRWKRLMLIFKLGRKKGGSDEDEAAGPALLPPPVSPGAELVTTPMGSPAGSPSVE